MTFFALPNVEPRSPASFGVTLEREVFSPARSRSDSETPSAPMPPIRSHSRRETPSVRSWRESMAWTRCRCDARHLNAPPGGHQANPGSRRGQFLDRLAVADDG